MVTNPNQGDKLKLRHMWPSVATRSEAKQKTKTHARGHRESRVQADRAEPGDLWEMEDGGRDRQLGVPCSLGPVGGRYYKRVKMEGTRDRARRQ